MFHQRVILNFFQLDSEPLFVAWERFKDLLCRVPMHRFSKECQLQIFINGLCNTTRNWVERGDGTTSFYQQTIDEAYNMLEDMAEYDRWSMSHSMNNYGWDNDSNMTGPWVDNESTEKLKTLEETIGQLANTTNQFMLETKQYLQIQQMAIISLGLQLDNLIAKRMINIKDHPVEDSTPLEKKLEMLQEESTKEGRTKDLSFKEELHEEIYDPKVVEPMSCIDVNKDLIWPTSSLPTLKALFEPQQPCAQKMSHVGRTCQKLYYHAKLEGNQIQEPWVVFYDTYYGRKPLFDELGVTPTPLHQEDVALLDGESTMHPLRWAVPIQEVFLSHSF